MKAKYRHLLGLLLVAGVACQPSQRTIEAVEFHAIGPLLILSPSAWADSQKVHVEWQLKANATCEFFVSWGDRQNEHPAVPNLFLAGFNEMDLYVDHSEEAYLVSIVCDMLTGGE